MVVLTLFILMNGLPIDWFQVRADVLAADGNLKMVIVQLALMSLGIVRVVGWYNWVLSAIHLDLTVAAMVALALTSTLWSADPGETIKQAIIFTVISFYGVYLVLRFPLREILELFARVFTASAAINLFFVFALPQYGISADSTWDGVHFQKNALGFAAMLAIPTLLTVGRDGPAWRHLYYLFIPLEVVLLLGSQSKTMLVATVGSVVLMLIYRSLRARRTMRGGVLISLIAVSIGAVAFATANIELLADWLDKDISLTGRVPMWQGLIPIAMQQPFFGYGFKAAFGGWFSPVHEVWVSEGWEPNSAHNAFIQIALELGLVGMFIYVFGYVRGVARALTTAATTVGAVGLWPLVYLSIVMLISVTESGVIDSQEGWLLYVVALLSVAQHVRQLRSGPGLAVANPYRYGPRPTGDRRVPPPLPADARRR